LFYAIGILTVSNQKEPTSEHRIARRLAAVFSADVQAYSRLIGDDEEATVRTVTAYREAMSIIISEHHGRVVVAPGDNILAEFSSAVDAVRAANEVQTELALRNAKLPSSRQMLFRIGINVGDVAIQAERIYGEGVTIAAHIEAIADGGGVCISGTVFDQVESKLPFSFQDIGQQTFDNILKPVRVYRLEMHNDQASPVTRNAAVVNQERAPTGAEKPSIAVLPFQNLSGDPEQEYFSDGMTEDLITDLSKISGLFVISRNSVLVYKNEIVTPEQVSEELGVRYLVEGSVRKSGNRVRISAQLVDAQTQYQLWAERYDRELVDIFELQDEVIKQIVVALAVKLTVGEQSRVGTPPTENLQAYDAFVRGREEYIRRDRSANLQARELFRQAIDLDPKYAEAYAFLGRTYLVEMVNQWSDAPDVLDKIFVYGDKAVELDESQPTAHETLAYGHVARRDHDRAINAARKAVQYAPNFAEGYITLAEVLCFSGESAEAVSLVEQAMRLNPHYTPNYLWALGQAHRLLGNYADAIRNFQRVVNRNPDHLVTHLMLAACFVETEQFDAAKIEAQEVLRINPGFSVEVSHQRSPYKHQVETDRQTESLRRAGLV
jgi:adenylate cyclase